MHLKSELFTLDAYVQKNEGMHIPQNAFPLFDPNKVENYSFFFFFLEVLNFWALFKFKIHKAKKQHTLNTSCNKSNIKQLSLNSLEIAQVRDSTRQNV